MEEVRDLHGHLICYCDGQTGELESAYKRQLIFATIPVGGKIAFVREGIATFIHRKTPSQFYVYSQSYQGT